MSRNLEHCRSVVKTDCIDSRVPYRASCLISNRRREARNGVVKIEDMHQAESDITDGQNVEFRYSY